MRKVDVQNIELEISMMIVKEVANNEAKLEVTMRQLMAVRLWLNLKFCFDSESRLTDALEICMLPDDLKYEEEIEWKAEKCESDTMNQIPLNIFSNPCVSRLNSSKFRRIIWTQIKIFLSGSILFRRHAF